MILAVDQGNAIGWADGRLPWKIPYDMKRFKELTSGHSVVMGFKTYKSLGLPDGLPARTNYVLTHRPYSEVRDELGLNVNVISSLEFVEQEALRRPEHTFWIIGGASVYAEALEKRMVDELHVTFVHEYSGADVTLPFDLVAWKLFLLQQEKHGVIWEVSEHIQPTREGPSPPIDILVFRKMN